MKKLIALMMAIVAVSFTSCSSDSDSSSSSSVVKFKVGGQQKTFKFVTVTDTGDGDKWVVAANSQAGTETLSFYVTPGDTTADAAYDFMYTSGTTIYMSSVESVTVSSNTTAAIKGTFAGNFTDDTTNSITITDGTFSIKY